MSIILGSATISGDIVSINPPGGDLGGINAVRLSNYTGALLILGNINSDRPGQEYLLPFQQNVYHIENLRQPPSVIAVQLDNNFPTESLLVEWSTEALDDFPGTYPTDLTQGGIIQGAPPVWNGSGLSFIDGVTVVTLMQYQSRVSISIKKTNGAGQVEIAPQPYTSPGSAVLLENPGDSMSMNTTGAIYLRARPGFGNVNAMYFFTAWGPEQVVA